MYLRLEIQMEPESPWTAREFEGVAVRAGRDPELELAFVSGQPSQRVSYDHAVFELRPEGLFVRDLDSKNGTYVNEEPVREQKLRVGNCVSLGRTGPKLRVLDFRLPKAASTPVPPAAVPVAGGDVRPDEPAHSAVRDAPSPDGSNGADAAYQRGVADSPSSLSEPASPAPPASRDVAARPGSRGSAGSAWSSTRRYVMVSLQQEGRRWKALAAVTTIGLVVVAVLLFTRENSESVGGRVHQRLLQSSVWVVSRGPDGELSGGTGALIDASRRLILTAAHVVEGVDEVKLYEPLYSDQGRVLVDQRPYWDLVRGERGRTATVLARDEVRDLALLQVDSLWDKAAVLRLAANSAEPGQDVHSLGALPSGFDVFWVYTSGKVRQVHQEPYTWDIPVTDGSGRPILVGGQPRLKARHRARIVVTQSPINPGDSGGPLVNNRGELIGVSHGAHEGVRGLSMFIDVSEVRHILRQLP